MILKDCNPMIRYACVSRIYKKGSRRRYKYLADCRAIYVLDGKGEIYFTGNDAPVPIAKSDLILLPAGCGFHIMCLTDTILAGIVCFDYTKDYKEEGKMFLAVEKSEFDPKTILKTEKFEDFEMFNVPTVVNNTSALRNHFLSVIETFEDYDEVAREQCSAMLKRFLCQLIQMQNNKLNYSDKRVNTILKYINNHYTENITNNDICDRIGYHSYYLNSIVRESTGNTIHWHLINRRIESSKRLLVTTDKSITDIADECGFFSQTKYSNCFKRYTGMTPTEYRHGMLQQPDSLI